MQSGRLLYTAPAIQTPPMNDPPVNEPLMPTIHQVYNYTIIHTRFVLARSN